MSEANTAATPTPAATTTTAPPAAAAKTEPSAAKKVLDDLGDQFKQWGRSIKGLATSGQKKEAAAEAKN